MAQLTWFVLKKFIQIGYTVRQQHAARSRCVWGQLGKMSCKRCREAEGADMGSAGNISDKYPASSKHTGTTWNYKSDYPSRRFLKGWARAPRGPLRAAHSCSWLSYDNESTFRRWLFSQFWINWPSSSFNSTVDTRGFSGQADELHCQLVVGCQFNNNVILQWRGT